MVTYLQVLPEMTKLPLSVPDRGVGVPRRMYSSPPDEQPAAASTRAPRPAATKPCLMGLFSSRGKFRSPNTARYLLTHPATECNLNPGARARLRPRGPRTAVPPDPI